MVSLSTGMYRLLYEKLKSLRATPEQLAGYDAAWAAAIRNPAQSIPCPVCFLEGRIERVSPMPRIHEDLARGKCESCKTYFVASEA